MTTTKEREPRRALVVGIDDYSAREVPPPAPSAEKVIDRRWVNLLGAGNDARAMAETLVERYGIPPAAVRLLLDHQATRAAILGEIERHLVADAQAGDHLVFFYAGHGSQVVNTRSDEPDGKDESLVPADSRAGAPDVRDKELRRLFNRALDRGARLTVVLDSCHSGSAVRDWLGERRSRAVDTDPRDAADASEAGPPLESRGALVLSAAQDFQSAHESFDLDRGRNHGAFTLALLRAIRMTSAGESAASVFQRARAWLLGTEGALQEPVLAGDPEARARPLMGGAGGEAGSDRPVPVESVGEDGLVRLQAGWVHGLGIDSELASRSQGDGRPIRLRVVALEGLAKSVAEVIPEDLPMEARALDARESGGNGSGRPAVGTGDLFVTTGWPVTLGPPLAVWIASGDDRARRWAARMTGAARARGIALSLDPTEGEPPTCHLSWRYGAWHLVGPRGAEPTDGATPEEIAERIAKASPGARLFIDVPVPEALRSAIETSTKESHVVVVEKPAEAAYFLIGRGGTSPAGESADGRIEVAWARPGATADDLETSPLPLRSRWHELPGPEVDGDPDPFDGLAWTLASDASGLARIDGWRWLANQAPRPDDFPYRMVLRPAGATRVDAEAAGAPPDVPAEVFGGDRFRIWLSAAGRELPRRIRRRYVYVFTIESTGRSVLLYPDPDFGNVECCFPVEPLRPYPVEIPLGEASELTIGAPFGLDNYYFLATSEPISDPRILECAGLRSHRAGPLERLLSMAGDSHRGAEPRRAAVSDDWILERFAVLARPGRERPR